MSEFSLVPLGQLAEIRMGQSPDSTYVYEGSEQGVPFLQGNAEFGVKHPAAKYSCTQPAKIAEQGSSLISVRAPVGETNIADQLYCIGRGLAAVKFHHYGESLGRELLSFNAKKLDKVSQGTTFAAIGGADLRTLLVADIPNQEAKVLEGVLDTLDTQIQKTEALIAKLEKVKEGLLHDLLTRGIDENGRLRTPPEQSPELYKDSPLGLIPRSWESLKLCEIAKKIIDGAHHTPTYTQSGVPFLRVTDIHSDTIDPRRTKFVSLKEHKNLAARCSPKKGDILLSKNGTVGIAKLINWDWEFSIFVSLAMISINACSGVKGEFLESVINSKIVKKQIENRSKQGTVTNLHLEEIRDFNIPTPPEEEQIKIANISKSYEDRVRNERHRLTKLLASKSGLMDDLLTGRVRVTPLLDQAQATTPA